MGSVRRYGDGVLEFSSGGCTVAVEVAVSTGGGDVGVGVVDGCSVTEGVKVGDGEGVAEGMAVWVGVGVSEGVVVCVGVPDAGGALAERVRLGKRVIVSVGVVVTVSVGVPVSCRPRSGARLAANNPRQ